MRRGVHRFSALVLAVAAVAAGACGGGEPERLVGTEVAIQAPAEPGSASTVPLLGFERGRGPLGVVLAHMLGSSQSAWILFEEELVRQGYHVLTFDFRGHGRSGGERDPSAAALDLGAAVERLRSLGATKIFVVGASMGGTAAVVVAAERRLEGVVAISPPERIDGLDAGAAAGRLDEPALFIVAQGDDRRYVDGARRLAERAPEPKRLEVVRGSAAHGTDLLTDEATRERVSEMILDFLAAYRG